MSAAIAATSALTGAEVTVPAGQVQWATEEAADSALWVLPGFVDAHRHLPHGLDDSSPDSVDAQRDAAAAIARREGVSLVLDMGVGVLRPWPHRPPWVKSALRGIQGPGQGPASRFAAMATTPGQCAELVAETADAGADHIKIFASGTGKQTREIACEQKLPDEMIAAATDAARARGLSVTAHCLGGPSARACAAAGVSSLEHGIYLTREDLAACAAAGMSLTFTPGVYIARHGEPMRERMRELVRDVLDTGVMFAVGTDTVSQTIADQVLLLIELGMPARLAIRAGADPGTPTCHLLFGGDPLGDPTLLRTPVALAT